MGKNTTIRVAISLGLFLFLAIPTARADVIGESHSFFVSTEYDRGGRDRITASLRGISDHAYIYVADEYWNALGSLGQSRLFTQIVNIGSEFDHRIYEQEIALFGSEPNPGIDGDPKVTLVLANLRSTVGGYFDSGNEYLISEVSVSNQREMIFLNTSYLPDLPRMYPFLAHEFQHLISFNQKEKIRGISDDIWLNELRSEYAVQHLGYNSPYQGSNLERRVQAFLDRPSDSVTEWKNNLSDYGQVALLGAYIAEHWSPRVIADQLTGDSMSIPSIDRALSVNGYADTFRDVFSGWMIANALNNPLLGARYAYKDPGLAQLRVSPTFMVPSMPDQAAFHVVITPKDWEQNWYDIGSFESGANSTLKVSFDGDVASLRVPYVVFMKDGTATVHLGGGPTIFIRDVGDQVIRVLLMPFTSQKLSSFSSNESVHVMTMHLTRVEPRKAITPEQFNLQDGDFIRAEGDKDVFIVNQHGFKRIVLSPKICLQYGHLGARGCFDAVHVVSPDIRDAFTTSPYYTNGETEDGNVYQLIETGEDTAQLKNLNTMLYAFQRDDFDARSVFRINNREQKSYQ